MDEIPPQVPGYRLTRLLGRGSTATVWRARRVADDELVAIKIVAGGADDEAVREFAMLQHAASDHVVTLHETLEVDIDDGRAIALVLEHLAGGSLGRVVAERGHLAAGETVTVIAPIAQALTGLHDLGLVHGDLSPGNVLLDSTGRPVLADLGYSRLTGEGPGDVHGTDGYIAPEVLDGEAPTRASDVHALGALAWLCLVGSAPGHVAERRSLRELVPDDAALADVVESCLATDPECRPEADEVARAVFDAATAAPLRMTASGDVGSSLTRRLRESAAGGEVHTPAWQDELVAARVPDPARRWWRVRRRPATTPRAKGGRHAAPRRSRDEPIDLSVGVTDAPSIESVRTGAADGVSSARALAAAAGESRGGGRWAAAVTVALGLALAVLVPWHQLASADGEPSRAPSTTTSSPAASAPSPTRTRQPAGATSPAAPTDPASPYANAASGRDRAGVGAGGKDAGIGADGGEGGVLASRAATRISPVELVAALTQLRQRVVASQDPVALRRLDEPGSPALARDRELLDQLSASGDRYQGFTMTVRSAQLVRTTGRSSVVGAVIDESAYAVVAADGTRQQRPARPGQRVDLVLAWDGRQWQVRDVQDPQG